MIQRAPVTICAKKCAPRLYALAHAVPFQVCPSGHVCVVGGGEGAGAGTGVGEGVGVGEGGGDDDTHPVPSQYCPEGHVVEVVEGVEVPQSEGQEELVSALSQTLFPHVPEPLDWGELQHAPLYQYQPEDAQIAESEQLAGVEHEEVELWQSLGQEPLLSPESHTLL